MAISEWTPEGWQYTVTTPPGSIPNPYISGGSSHSSPSFQIGGGTMYIGQPFVATPPSIFDPLRKPNKLTEAQLDRLMDHEFIPMAENGTGFCLLCFALDTYRNREQHDYVIHED